MFFEDLSPSTSVAYISVPSVTWQRFVNTHGTDWCRRIENFLIVIKHKNFIMFSYTYAFHTACTVMFIHTYWISLH